MAPNLGRTFEFQTHAQVRKEVSTQRFNQDRVHLPTVISFNEEIVRFLITSGHDLAGTQGFDSHLNQEQMNKVRHFWLQPPVLISATERSCGAIGSTYSII